MARPLDSLHVATPLVLRRIPWSFALLGAVLALPAAADPRADYLLHCGGCHLPSGRGAPPEVPTLVGTLGPIVATPEGRSYVLRVPGASQSPLDDGELARVMNWVLDTLNADTLPADFRPLQTREVTEARRHVLADPIAYRKRLWPEYD